MAASTVCWPTMPSAPIPPPPELVVSDLAGTTVYDHGEVPAAFSAVVRTLSAGGVRRVCSTTQ